MNYLPYVHNWYLGLDDPAKDIVKASVGPTVAILIFVLTQIVQALFAWSGKLSKRRSVIIGIYKEISDNIEYGQKFLKSENIETQIKNRIIQEDKDSKSCGKEPSYRPMVAITESSKFYEAVSESVPSINTTCMLGIIAYYRSVADQKMIAEIIQSSSYLVVSVESRCSTIDDLWQAFDESGTKGSEALRRLERRYPPSWFKKLKP